MLQRRDANKVNWEHYTMCSVESCCYSSQPSVYHCITLDNALAVTRWFTLCLWKAILSQLYQNISLSNTVNRQSAPSNLSSLCLSVKIFSNISPRSERPPSDPRQQYTGEESCTTERQRMLWSSDVRCNSVIMWSDDGAQTGIGQSPHWWLDWAWVQCYLPGPG